MQHATFDQAPDALLQEQRIALRGFNQPFLDRKEFCVRANQRVEQFVGAARGKRIDAQLCKAAFSSPPIFVFRTIIHEQQHSCGRNALQQHFQERLGFRINPVHVLDHQAQRLILRLADQKSLDGVKNQALTLERMDIRPAIIADRDTQGPG